MHCFFGIFLAKGTLINRTGNILSWHKEGLTKYKAGEYMWTERGTIGMLKTTSGRITAMHERARLLRRARDKTINSVLGAVSFLMLAGIVMIAALSGGGLHPVGNTGHAGSSLLYEGAGGYVLVAVISFMAAVVITVLCMRWNKKKALENPDNEQ